MLPFSDPHLTKELGGGARPLPPWFYAPYAPECTLYCTLYTYNVSAQCPVTTTLWKQ